MKRFAITAALAGSIAVSGCATNGYNDPYYGSRQTNRTAAGAVIGAAVGAGVGAVVPGVSPVTGAIAGGIAGAVLGNVIKGRQYYRDTRGYCHYVDQYGRPIYDYNTRC
ncbi:MAG: hypothetical protein ABIP91_03380 [Sphingomicrobium sp.]